MRPDADAGVTVSVDQTAAWAGLHAAHDAGRAAERGDVLAHLAQHRARLLRVDGVSATDMEVRRFDELVAAINAGLHAGGAA